MMESVAEIFNLSVRGGEEKLLRATDWNGI